MENKNYPQVLLCACNSPEHQIIIINETDASGSITFAEVHLKKHTSFIKRLVYGIRYIFGYQCRYGAFEDFIFKPEDADRIEDIAKHLRKELE